MKMDLYWSESIYTMVERSAGTNSRVLPDYAFSVLLPFTPTPFSHCPIVRYIDKTFDDTIKEEVAAGGGAGFPGHTGHTSHPRIQRKMEDSLSRDTLDYGSQERIPFCGCTPYRSGSNSVTSLIINNLEQGNSILVRNLGCFDLLVRKERSCPNPVTGEKVIIPEHTPIQQFPG